MNPIDDEKKIEDGPEEKGEFGRERGNIFAKILLKTKKKLDRASAAHDVCSFFLTGEQVSWNHYPKDIYIYNEQTIKI